MDELMVDGLDWRPFELIFELMVAKLTFDLATLNWLELMILTDVELIWTDLVTEGRVNSYFDRAM